MPQTKSIFRSILTGFLLFTCHTSVFSQSDKPIQFLIHGKVEGNDTIPFIVLPTVEIFATMTDEDREAMNRYRRLRNSVLKVYPYARFAATKFDEINRKAATMSPRERRRYIRDEEDKAKDLFAEELKNLTYSQGKILIKLVDRETGKTSYELVKEMRGSFKAFLWQGMARLFTADLKATYDSTGEDRQIEQIVRGIERGEIK